MTSISTQSGTYFYFTSEVYYDSNRNRGFRGKRWLCKSYCCCHRDYGYFGKHTFRFDFSHSSDSSSYCKRSCTGNRSACYRHGKGLGIRRGGRRHVFSCYCLSGNIYGYLCTYYNSSIFLKADRDKCYS